MKACPTNTLQPVWFMAGPEGIFSPVLKPRLGPCALNCNECGKVCPTGAIRYLPLIEKQSVKMGSAWIIRRNCLVWEQDRKCLVCDEVCPYNALSFRPVKGLKNAAPFVIENRCTGCGWCENKCPVLGWAAIRVNIIGEVRLLDGSYIEKARQLGFVFKTRDNSHDELASGTFDGLETGPPDEGPAEKPDKDPNKDLPEGFILE
jgi:ferredoxin